MKSYFRIYIAIFTSLILAFSGLANAAEKPLKLTIDTENTGPQISKYIYGHFAEHLGRGIYEGIWVGEDSDIPNTNGFRNDVIAALKDLQIPVIRWPGGCFADEYHWREGIGPRDERPVKVNTHWGGVEENNEFGTHEFFDLVEMLGTDAYVAGNIGSGSPQEMAEWLEYMTSDTTSTLANLRRKNGREKPWKVAFFGVGNETWGCGGNMRPEYYADLYRRYATFLKAPEGNRPKLVASGGMNDNTDWTRVLASTVNDGMMAGISHHYYTLPTGKWPPISKSTGFDESEWIATMFHTIKIDKYLDLQEEQLAKHNPKGNVGIYLDEWGTWYGVEPGHEKTPGFLYQQNSLRDAVLAAVNFNIFHEHAERLHMANIAQTVNVLQAMILTDKEKMLRTPTYHVFKMYIPFQDSTFVPVKFKKMSKYEHADFTVPSVTASAAKTKNGELVLALANLDPNKEANIVIDAKGLAISKAEGEVLTGATIDAHNTFAAPDKVVPQVYKATAKDGELQLKLPSKSVVVVTLN